MKAILLVWVVMVPVIVTAQPDFGDDVDDVNVPFDGGVGLLVAAGIGYGIKKVRDQRKVSKQNNEV